MKQINQDGLKKMIVDAFQAHYDKYSKSYDFDSYVKLITTDDDFSDMLRKYSIFIGYLLGRFNADVVYYDPTYKIIKLLCESNEVMVLIYAFGGDKDAVASLKNKGIEIIN